MALIVSTILTSLSVIKIEQHKTTRRHKPYTQQLRCDFFYYDEIVTPIVDWSQKRQPQ